MLLNMRATAISCFNYYILLFAIYCCKYDTEIHKDILYIYIYIHMSFCLDNFLLHSAVKWLFAPL